MDEREADMTPLHSTFADDPEMADVVEVFIRQLPHRIESLRSLMLAGELEALRDAAHQIKGAGGGYGYPTMSEKAADLERLLHESQPDHEAVDRALRDLVQLCERARIAA